MKVLKVTFEIPLADKAAAQRLRDAGVLVAGFTKTLDEAGFKGTLREETIVTRPGRG